MHKINVETCRGGGKTEMLTDHIARYIGTKPDASVLVVTPTSIQRDVVIKSLQKKVTYSELKKIHFIQNNRNISWGRTFDAVYIDNVDLTIYPDAVMPQATHVLFTTRTIPNEK